jgi:NAD(P)-dependent dehydrogenase (short-subunit alcohol dehydrogenase family)
LGREAANGTALPIGHVYVYYTGASSGIGLGLNQALLGRGWRVAATSRTISESKDLKPTPDLVLLDGDASKRETTVEVACALNQSGPIAESTYRSGEAVFGREGMAEIIYLVGTFHLIAIILNGTTYRYPVARRASIERPGSSEGLTET